MADETPEQRVSPEQWFISEELLTRFGLNYVQWSIVISFEFALTEREATQKGIREARFGAKGEIQGEWAVHGQHWSGCSAISYRDSAKRTRITRCW